jgi:hypothetical protein
MKKLKKAQDGDAVSAAKKQASDSAARPALKPGGKSPRAQNYAVNPMFKADMENRGKRLDEAKMRQERFQFDKQRRAAQSAMESKMAESAMEAKSVPKKKMGGMIKRADGSMSKRGLWDNIRANKGSGKKPTAAMLKQEKKIKAQTKKK